MIKHSLIVFAMLLSGTFLLAQNGKYDGNYDVLLKSGTTSFEANVNDFVTNPTIITNEVIDGYFYRFIQFENLPDVATLLAIEQAGVILFDYVPHKTYVAGIPANLNFSDFNTWNVRSIQPINSLHKLGKSALGPVYPEWAERGNEIQLVVNYYRNISSSKATQLFQNNGINVIQLQPNSQTAVIQILKSEIDVVAGLDFLYYVESTPSPPIPEDRLGRTLHRSNVINTMVPSGKHYDGTGVNILTRDDGQIGPHIDFENRATQSGGTAASGTHGDGVAGIMGGAGNLDPTIQGMAPGSHMYVVDYVANFSNDNTLQLHQQDNVMITNSSYSDGCNDGYTTNARVVDLQTYQNPSLLHVFSAGNSNNNNCGYGAGTQWGNITGGHKIGKNVIATANLYPDGSLVASSSRGPSEDGRLKPDISSNGQDQLSISTDNTYQSFGGTSGAAPGIAGVATQLYDAYRQFNNGNDPESSLIKAAMLNSAEDYGNPGPDFIYGWGRVNAYRALDVIENNNYINDQIAAGGSNNHIITVPANVKQVKVMTYWAEPAASVNASLVLTNDLDMTMTTPTSEVLLPWVLDNTPNTTALNADATRGVDNINNVEQVTIDNPSAGAYTVNVQAPVVSTGTASYYVITTFIYDEIKVVYPLGGEGLIPGTTERIHWDAFGTQASFGIEMTTDGGNSWFTIANVPGAQRMYDWTVPNAITGQAQVRISRGNNTGQSEADFSIIGRPENIVLTKVCPNVIRIEWDSLADASAYDVFILGYQYMDSVGTTNDTYFDIPVANGIDEHWVALRGVGANGLRGRRTIAEQFSPTNLLNCLFNNDVALTSIVSPAGYTASCAGGSNNVVININNNSVVAQSNFNVSYEFNGAITTEMFTDTIPSQSAANYTFTAGIGTQAIGNYNITAWTDLVNEDFNGNDTASTAFSVATGTVVTLPLAENFDAFTTCPTTNNCGNTVCPLGNSWINLTNGTEDDIDWRTDANGTPTNSSGPAGDHTTGSGNYVYFEASNGCYGEEAVLVSPCVDLTTALVPQLSFWYHADGADMGELHVDVFDGAAWIEDAMPPVVGDQGNAWIQGFVNLQPYAGSIINIRFRGITGDGFSSDLALDDIDISEVTTPPTASFTTSGFGSCIGNVVELIDQSGNVPNTWNWTITPTTFNFVGGTNANSQNPLVTFNNAGFYDIQLNVTNPNGVDSTIQYGVVSISNGDTLPYMQDFQGSFPPAGLTIENADNGISWQLSTATGSDGNATQAASVNNFNYNSSGQEDKMVLTVDLSNETAASITFDVAHARYNGTYADALRVDVYTNCGDSFGGTLYNKSGADLATSADQTGAYTPGSAADWRNENIDLTPFVGTVLRIEIINVTDYGNNTFVDNINITNVAGTGGGGGTGNGNGDVFSVDFSATQGNLCLGQAASVFDNSTGTGLTYNWDFGTDATPQTATTAGPHSFTYSTVGAKTIKVVVTDANGAVDSLTQSVFIEDVPVANFTLIQQNDSTIKVFNGASGANSFVWDFGDGNTSLAQNPTYQYDSSSTFTITLSVDGNCGSDVATEDVLIQLVNSENILATAENISVFPNPSEGRYTVNIDGLKEDLTLHVIDVQGRILRTWQQPNPTSTFTKTIDITDFAEGVYFLQIQTESGIDMVKLILNK